MATREPRAKFAVFLIVFSKIETRVVGLSRMNGDSDSDDGRDLSVEDAAFFGGNAGGFLEGLTLPYVRSNLPP